MGSLLVGVSFAKSLAMGLNIPLLAINHIQAHVLAHFIKDKTQKIPEFPFLCLTISGGHTQIVKLSNYFEFKVLGQTIDDAVGEAFDKSAKILGFDYPGGPFVDKYAQLGNPLAFKFPNPKTKNPLDFSFSGLKTAILYFIQKKVNKNPNFIEENRNDLCASIQYTIVNILMTKLSLAVAQTGIKQVAIAGGVSANSGIRKALLKAEKERGWQCLIPKYEYTTDNAAMIGIAGYYAFLQKKYATNNTIAKARIPL